MDVEEFQYKSRSVKYADEIVREGKAGKGCLHFKTCVFSSYHSNTTAPDQLHNQKSHKQY